MSGASSPGRRWLGAVVVLGLANTACPPAPGASPQPTSPLASSSSSAAPAEASPLARARELRRRYEHLTPPTYSRSGTDENERQFMMDLSGWMRTNAPLWNDTRAAYEQAARSATDTASRFEVLGELLDAAVAAQARLTEAARSFIPPQLRANPAFVREFDAVIASRVKDVWVAPVARECLERAKAQQYDGPVATRCRAAAAEFQSTAPARVTHLAPPLPLVPTTRVGACAFAGTLEVPGAKLYATEQTDEVVARVFLGDRLEIERLEPARRPGGRARVVLQAPLRGTVWLDADAAPFALPTRTDVVPGHVWFDAGTPVRAVHAGAGLVLSPPLSLVKVPALRAPSIECASWRFATSGQDSAEPDAGPHDWRTLAQRDIAIAAARSGAVIAKIAGGLAVDVIERRDGYAHVRRRGAPIAIDGWVVAADVGEPSLAFGLVRSYEGEPRRARAGAVVALRTGAAPDSPSPGTLAPDAVVFETRREGNACAVTVPDLAPPTDRDSFYADCQQLEAADVPVAH